MINEISDLKDCDSPIYLENAGLNISKYTDVISYLFVKNYSSKFPTQLNEIDIINAINYHGGLNSIVEKELRLKYLFGNNKFWSPYTNKIKNMIITKLSQITKKKYDKFTNASKMYDRELCSDLITNASTYFDELLYNKILMLIDENLGIKNETENLALEIFPNFTKSMMNEDVNDIDIINRETDTKIQVKSLNSLKAIEHDGQYFILLKNSHMLDLSKYTSDEHLTNIDALLFVNAINKRAFKFNTDNIIKIRSLKTPKVIDGDSFHWYIQLKTNELTYYEYANNEWYSINNFKKIFITK